MPSCSINVHKHARVCHEGHTRPEHMTRTHGKLTKLMAQARLLSNGRDAHARAHHLKLAA
eukprot:14729157-Alexandrium_andersonii.AAC.1